MKLINGQFYEKGVKIPLEFGNKEQIRLINEANQKLNELNGDGEIVDVEIIKTASINFTCICGSAIYIEEELEDWEELEDIQTAGSCQQCKRKYDFYHNGNDVIAKIKTDEK